MQFTQHLSFLPASIPLPLSRNDSVEVANQKRLLRTLELLTNRLKRTLSKQPLSTFHVSSEMIVADPKSLESKKAYLYCRPGSVLKGRMCGELLNSLLYGVPSHASLLIIHFLHRYFLWISECKLFKHIFFSFINLKHASNHMTVMFFISI